VEIVLGPVDHWVDDADFEVHKAKVPCRGCVSFFHRLAGDPIGDHLAPVEEGRRDQDLGHAPSFEIDHWPPDRTAIEGREVLLLLLLLLLLRHLAPPFLLAVLHPRRQVRAARLHFQVVVAWYEMLSVASVVRSADVIVLLIRVHEIHVSSRLMEAFVVKK